MTERQVLLLLLLLGVSSTSVVGEHHEGYFWQLNDLHYDPTYWGGKQASCNEPVPEPGRFGDFMCDSPWALIRSSVEAMKEHGDKPDFITWSGDLPPHYKPELGNVTEELLLEIIQNVTTLLLQTFPDVPILPVIGNHDYVPKNELPGEKTPIYEKIADIWSPLFNDSATKERFKKGASYSKQLTSTLRAVVYNSNIYNSDNPLTLGDDPGNMFKWIDDELAEAKRLEQKVYLFTHISPGANEVMERKSGYYKPDYNARILGLLKKYGDTIRGTFTGHAHFDSFKVVRNDEGEAVSGIYISPSVTPWRTRLPREAEYGDARNPAIRKIYYSPDDYSLQDIEQFYLDLSEANMESSAEEPEWEKLYTFTELYGLDSVNASQLQRLIGDFKTADRTKFDAYYLKNAVRKDNTDDGKTPALPACDCTCKANHVCAIEFIDQDEYQDCLDMGTEYVCPGGTPGGDGGSGGGGGASSLQLNFVLFLSAVGILSLMFVRK